MLSTFQVLLSIKNYCQSSDSPSSCYGCCRHFFTRL